MVKRSWKVPQGKAVPLTDDEKALVVQVREKTGAINAKISSHEHIDPQELKTLGRLAHELHMSLRKNGHEPKHTKIMISNRRLKPTDPGFYEHIHPIEDLLGFLENENANDDPVDLTVGHEFDFPVYSRRWKHEDIYHLKRTADGWQVRHNESVDAGRDARVSGEDGTGLFKHFVHDSINYPADLPAYFDWLWERARDRGLDHNEVQEAISALAKWVSVCEAKSPAGIFEAFK
jgi:integron cassette protein